ncbi:protoporphyrinogen oxidase HemJ [Aliarcobacter skirrowii]|uniref:protoporphyrinogen oxidase HemJ n=1 Tax=Aliarcobacter skirrowii TaxID=28200 RepID=UPI0029AFEFBF|nr:protoporphyrinogen oxidase HemJ [Aliarcobacter skirrowii]MDX4058685.1 protoporphyrinogen oxidase HemJ [Aliarcobacter skirrowii]
MEYYTWILSLHIIAVLSWMAMLFYLPRLFVYHVENIDKKEFVEVVKIQEFKIYKYIGHPAMWVTIFSGVAMISLNPALLTQDWFIAKIFMLVLLVAYSLSLEYYRKALYEDRCDKSGKFFRMYNEMPTMLAILIVTYVITKNLSILFTFIIIVLFAFISYMILKPKKLKS